MRIFGYRQSRNQVVKLESQIKSNLLEKITRVESCSKKTQVNRYMKPNHTESKEAVYINNIRLKCWKLASFCCHERTHGQASFISSYTFDGLNERKKSFYLNTEIKKDRSKSCRCFGNTESNQVKYLKFFLEMNSSPVFAKSDSSYYDSAYWPSTQTVHWQV